MVRGRSAVLICILVRVACAADTPGRRGRVDTALFEHMLGGCQRCPVGHHGSTSRPGPGGPRQGAARRQAGGEMTPLRTTSGQGQRRGALGEGMGGVRDKSGQFC